MALPNIISVTDRQSFDDALGRVLEPYFEDIVKKIDDVSASNPNMSQKKLVVESGIATVDILEKALTDIAHKQKESGTALTNTDVLKIMTDFSKESVDSQNTLVARLMTNDKALKGAVEGITAKVFAEAVMLNKSAEDSGISKKIDDVVMAVRQNTYLNPAQGGGPSIAPDLDEPVVKAVDKLNDTLSKNSDSTIDSEREKKAKKEKKGDEPEQGALMKKLLDFLSKNDSINFISAVSNGLSKLAFGVGAIGLVSMIPKEARRFIDDFTASFQVLRTMVESNLLSPITKLFTNVPLLGKLTSIIPSFFSSIFKIFDHMPLIGAILKKVPFLNTIFAAFEIIPKMLEKYRIDGVWGALEAGLKGIYDFFVGDVLNLFGKFLDWVQLKVFNTELIDFSSMAQNFNKMIGDVITKIIDATKALFSIDFRAFGERAMSLAVDIFKDVTHGISSVFSDIDWSGMAKAAGDWVMSLFKMISDTISEFISSSVKEWFTGSKSEDNHQINRGIMINGPRGQSQIVQTGADELEQEETVLTKRYGTYDSKVVQSMQLSVDTFARSLKDKSARAGAGNTNVNNSRTNSNVTYNNLAIRSVTESGPLSTSNGGGRR